MSVITTTRERVGNLLSESIPDNPVVVREFRTRMRGRKAFVVMGGYVLLIAVVVAITYYFQWQNVNMSHAHGFSPVDQKIGLYLFLALNWTQSILLVLIVPALTSGLLTQELEKKTIEMLALTRLSTGKIVFGKQFSGFLYSLILLVCSLPLAGLCLMFGGISPAEVAITYALLVSSSFLFAATGIFWSSLFNKTATSALFTYGTCGAFLLIASGLGTSLVAGHYGYSSEALSLALIHPGWAPFGAFATAKVCGLTVPVAIAGFVLHILVASLLILVAATHVKYRTLDWSLPIKLMTIVISAILLWLIVGDQIYIDNFSYGDMDSISIFATILVIVLSVAAAVFATGQVRRGDKPLPVYALSFRKAFKGDLGGAIPFMATWTVISYFALGVTLYWAYKAYHSAGPSINHWKTYFGMGVAVFSIVVAVAALGVLASTIIRQRRGAVALTILFLLVLYVGYAISLAYYEQGVSKPNAIAWQLAAFWPLTPFIAMPGDWDSSMPKLWWPHKHTWIVTTSAYALITVVALGLATAASKRFEGVQED